MHSPAAPAPRRVALVTNGLTRGGAETQLVHLAAALRARGDEVGLLSILPTEAFADTIAGLHIPVAHLRVRGPLKGPSAVLAGAKVLRAWQPDAVISFVYQANVLGRVAGRLAGVPVVISSVRNEYFGGRSRELVLRATDRFSAATTTNSAGVAKSLVARGIVPADRMHVIPNGIDTAPFEQAAAERDAVRRDLGLAGDCFAWFAAGRLEAQKDYPTLLAALARCAPTDPEHVVLIAGQGQLRQQLEQTAADLGVAGRVRFLGVRADVAQLMAAADALVLSSRHEGLPNVVMEAMAAGRPVVATRVGGTPELVQPDVSGLLVPPGDPGALAGAMSHVMSTSEPQRHAMGAAGRSIISEQYSLAALAERWLQLLDSCLERSSLGAAVRAPLSAAVPGAVV